MIALIAGYAMTLFGLVFVHVHDFMAMGVIFSGIGVVITLVHGVKSEYKLRGYGISLGIHALLWILSSASPNFLGNVLGFLIAIPLAIVLIAVLLSWLKAFFGSDDEGDISRLPNTIYDSRNIRWEIYKRGVTWATYENLAGTKLTINQVKIGQNMAETDRGWFHW